MTLQSFGYEYANHTVLSSYPMQFCVSCFECVGLGTLRSLPRCPYNYLRNVHITGFKGTKGQLEFLVHTVENAYALEVLTINPKKQVVFVFVKIQDTWLVGTAKFK